MIEIVKSFGHAMSVARHNNLRHTDWTFVDSPEKLRGIRLPFHKVLMVLGTEKNLQELDILRTKQPTGRG